MWLQGLRRKNDLIFAPSTPARPPTPSVGHRCSSRPATAGIKEFRGSKQYVPCFGYMVISTSVFPPSSPSSPSAITYAARSGLDKTLLGIPITSIEAASTSAKSKEHEKKSKMIATQENDDSGVRTPTGDVEYFGLVSPCCQCVNQGGKQHPKGRGRRPSSKVPIRSFQAAHMANGAEQ